MSNQDTSNSQPTLNGSPVTPAQLQEERGNLKKSERIVEVDNKPGTFRKLQRMQE